MKKRVIAVILAAMMVGAMAAGCGGNAKPVENNGDASTEAVTEGSTESAAAGATEAETVKKKTYPDEAYLDSIKASDYVELPDYSAITVEASKEEVTTSQVESYIDSVLQNSKTKEEVKDRKTVKDGDVVNIDYTGKIDGKTFDGGSAKDQDLTIGSNTFIDGFEDGLIGKKVGSKVTLNLTFPKDYSKTDLAGKAVTFEVTINKIYKEVTPTLNDDFVKKQGISDVTTVDQYKAYIKKMLQQQAQRTYDQDVDSQITDYIEKNTTFKKDPPDAMVNRFDDEITTAYTQYAQQYGVDLPTLMSFEGYTKDNYEEGIREIAENSAKSYIAFQAIADKEGWNVTDEQFQNAEQQYAYSQGYTSIESFESAEDAKEYKEYLMTEMVLQHLRQTVKVTEPKADSSTGSTEASTEDAAVNEASTENAATASASGSDAAASSSSSSSDAASSASSTAASSSASSASTETAKKEAEALLNQKN